MTEYYLEDGAWSIVIDAKGRLREFHVPCDDDGVENDAPKSVKRVLEVLLSVKDFSLN